MSLALNCIWNRNTGLSQTKLNFETVGCSAGNDDCRSMNNLAKQNDYAMRFSRADSHQTVSNTLKMGTELVPETSAVYPRKFH
jgi:hypothetical protein